MSISHRLYELGFNDGLNMRGIDPRYKNSQEYLSGYDAGIEQRKLNLKRLIMGLNK